MSKWLYYSTYAGRVIRFKWNYYNARKGTRKQYRNQYKLRRIKERLGR